MTRTQTRAYGLLTPSTRQPLLEAMLRAFCWLVSNVVSLFGMTSNRNTRDWHTDRVEEDQHPTSNDTCAPAFILRDDRRSAPIPQDEAGGRSTESRSPNKHDSTKALILRDREAIVSKDGGVLTALSPLMPTNVGIQGRRRTLSRLAASSPRTRQNRSWIPKPHPELVEGRRNERFSVRIAASISLT